MKKILTLMGCVILMLNLWACDKEDNDFLKITALKVGKADAIILETASGAVLIDAGEKKDGGDILDEAVARKIDKFDYMIITHYDKDHVGGAKKVIEGIEIGQIIEPGYEWDSEEFDDYNKAAEKAKIKRTVPKSDMTFKLGNVKFTIMMPKNSSYENKNNYSIMVKAECGGHSALFAGDALDIRMEEVMSGYNISADILKIPHHGSFESKSEDFFKKVNPEYAIITCSEKNPADEATVKALEKLGCKVLSTEADKVEIVVSKSGVKNK